MEKKKIHYAQSLWVAVNLQSVSESSFLMEQITLQVVLLKNLDVYFFIDIEYADVIT